VPVLTKPAYGYSVLGQGRYQHSFVIMCDLKLQSVFSSALTACSTLRAGTAAVRLTSGWQEELVAGGLDLLGGLLPPLDTVRICPVMRLSRMGRMRAKSLATLGARSNVVGDRSVPGSRAAVLSFSSRSVTLEHPIAVLNESSADRLGNPQKLTRTRRGLLPIKDDNKSAHSVDRASLFACKSKKLTPSAISQFRVPCLTCNAVSSV
jgi:hypothetical protein